MAEEFVEHPEINTIKAAMGSQKINSITINLDQIGTLTPAVVHEIVRRINHTVDYINIEEYHTIEQVDIELFFK